MATTVGHTTLAEFLAIPDDGTERDLIRGVVREYGVPRVTRRNRRHSHVQAALAHVLVQWLHTRPEPRGEMLVGEAGFRVRRDPETHVGIDAAYVSADVAAASAPDDPYLDGVPVLAAEILSPSDTLEKTLDKVEEYLEVGVAQVWLLEPRFRTVTVYRRDVPPVMYSAGQELRGDPELPGFSVAIADLFPRY